MTTTIDPGGTPTVIYNRDGATITALNSAGSGQSSSTPIVRYTSTTIVVVTSTTSPTQQGVRLPNDPEIGDVVETYHAGQLAGSAGSFHVYPASGWYIGDQAVDVGIAIPSCGAVFRYLGSSLWGERLSA